ncbi:AAA family ATPase [Photobacterium minamisatsumaniensis]|uniref:AAA family ATPase n=1 Tax=Photobacterium minamisatsumaniensis TaxID=2910233 RepID=UPI003D0B7F8F
MNTTKTLPEKGLISPMKQPLQTAITGWIISDNKEFTLPLVEYFTHWSNAKLKIFTHFEYLTYLKNETKKSLPDLIILDSNIDWELITDQIKNKLDFNPPIILITNDSSTSLLRKALKIEIKDVLSIPFDESELDQIIYHCAKEKSSNRTQGRTSVFINAKGGMGSTIIATSIAHILALQNQSIALIDPDAQFGCSAGILSTKAKFILSDALEQVDTIDEYALSGMLTKHESGLRFITNRSEHLTDNIPEFTSAAFNDFIEQVKISFTHTVIDLSRGLENSTLPALSSADDVFIVVQQNIPAIKEAAALIKQLKHLFGFNQKQIKVIINRYSKESDLKPADIKSTLHVDDIILIPNDYLSVSASTNLGELLATHYEKKPITKALSNLANIVAGVQIEEASGLKRFFSFLRS